MHSNKVKVLQFSRVNQSLDCSTFRYLSQTAAQRLVESTIELSDGEVGVQKVD